MPDSYPQTWGQSSGTFLLNLHNLAHGTTKPPALKQSWQTSLGGIIQLGQYILSIYDIFTQPLFMITSKMDISSSFPLAEPEFHYRLSNVGAKNNLQRTRMAAYCKIRTYCSHILFSIFLFLTALLPGIGSTRHFKMSRFQNNALHTIICTIYLLFNNSACISGFFPEIMIV
jgi:hypothetical protein